VNVSLYQAASALNANSRWQEMISENLASSSIPGFKKQDLSFSAVQSGLMPTATTGFPQHFTLSRADVATNFRPGEIQSTGSKTDVALEGPGFFAVQMPNGTTGYTRDGEFQINALGELVTKQGYTVLGDAGPIRLNLSDTSSPLSISPTGEVSQGSELRGKLRVVDFQQPQLLTPAGGGFFIAQNQNLVPTAISQPSIRQGYLEAANASSVSEMANLISAMRGFEANQRVIQLHDDRMGRAISDLGNPS
jgi:flagellar basal body rod protein FlgG